METQLIPETLRRLQIPGQVEIVTGQGGLPLVKIKTPWSSAEIYLNGAHVAHFQKDGEPPLIFMSAKSYFAPDKAIRGGVPICFPWFGNRDDDSSHGFARFTEWQLVKTATTDTGAVTLQFSLPEIAGRPDWKSLRTDFFVTVAATLTMELVTTNDSCGETLTIENCLHTYFLVGDIGAISLNGLENIPFDDFAFGANGARRSASDSALRITQETNRVYPNHSNTVTIRDEKSKRVISVEKSNSQSTVVWNPWTTQKLPDDFDPAEHAQMVCVESGNVKQNRLILEPGQTTALKAVLSSEALK
jgi:D-hexose-6-phosphate mutarotase